MTSDEEPATEIDARTLRIAGVVAAMALAALVATLGRWIAIDDAIWRAVLFLRGCAADRALDRAITIATRTLTAALVCAIVLHAWTAGARSTWPWVATSLLGLVASKALKHVLARDRPSALPDLALGYSFPSAHVMNSVLAAIAIVVLARRFRHRGRWYAVAGACVAMLASGRVLLGHHWASDVVGGVLAAIVLAGLAAPALARRPVAASVAIGIVLAAVLMLDRGAQPDQLPSPLVGRRTAVVALDVGAADPALFRGDWSAGAPEPPFGAFRWLAGAGVATLDVPEGTVRDHAALRLAFAGRPQKAGHACAMLDVALNGTRLGRFAPFVGWREYRLPVPPGVVRAGANELGLDVGDAHAAPPFGLLYVRLAPAPSAE